MKNRLFTFMKYRIPFYIVTVLLMTLLFALVYEVKSTPSYDETVFYFIASEDVDSALESKLYNGYESTDIKTISVDNSNPSSFYYSIVFNTRGMTNTDIVIIPLSKINTGSYGTYFSKIDKENISSLLENGNFEYYTDSDNYTYGIKVNDYLKDYLDINEDLYLFFNKKSSKNAYVSGSGNDDSLISLKNLLSEKIK